MLDPHAELRGGWLRSVIATRTLREKAVGSAVRAIANLMKPGPVADGALVPAVYVG